MPGQTASAPRKPADVTNLQWRAGQLPGQTVGLMAMMSAQDFLQWRAGQLPGQTAPVVADADTVPLTFNGGPGNCPAKHPCP